MSRERYWKKFKADLRRELFRHQEINASGKLTHLQAPDLFYNGAVQVFAAKSGKYLGIAYKGDPIHFEDPQDEPQPEPEQPTPKAQLKLF